MLFRDVSYAVRQLRRAPGFAATIVLTLALSVGVATAVFCVIDTVILRPLPFSAPQRIVEVEATSRSGYQQPVSWPTFNDQRAQAGAFSALAAYFHSRLTVETPSNGPVALSSVRASDNFFQVFNVRPLLGRTFLPGEEQEGRNNVVVLSYGAWQKYFSGDRNILNQTVNINGRTYAVIGVMPAGFRFPLNLTDALYTPMFLDAGWMKERGTNWLQLVARLKSGTTLEQAQTDVAHVFTNIGKIYPQTDGGRTVKLIPLSFYVTRNARGPLWMLLAAVLAVLAIGCVNVAGLLMARGVKREREMAVRTAMGASRTRLIRQLLSEGFLLALLGATGGLLVAISVLALMRSFLVKSLERGADIQMNWLVLGAAVGVALVVSLCASLFPALRLSGIDPNHALKTGQSAGTGRAQHRLRSGFVVTQVALTLVLLAVSGLLLRSLSRYFHSNLGFDPAHILAIELNLSPARYLDRDNLTGFYAPLEEKVQHLPGVQAAGIINMLPIAEWGNNSDIHIAGQPPYPPNQQMLAENRFVSSGYFDVFRVPLVSGRALSPALDRDTNLAPTVVVNQAFVRKFIPAGLDPTRQRIEGNGDQRKWIQIVGVTGNVRQDIYQEPLAERDWLINELPPKTRLDWLSHGYLVVRTTGDPTQVAPAIRSIVHQLDPTVPFIAPRTMTEVVSQTLVFERMESWLFGIFAALALVLALVGLYGLVSHEVEQATRDIGVRMALGATRTRVVGVLMQRVTWMLGAGVAAGLVLTVATRKLIAMVVVFDAQKETWPGLALALLIVCAGLVAALVPALRAASIDPMQALRNE